MYESYTRQALPSKEYREILGAALCVFVSNNQFIIENILNIDPLNSWYKLIDKTSGELRKDVKNTISEIANKDIEILFEEIVNKRNRIIHSFQYTTCNNEQELATKDKNNKQFHIDNKYLLNFIKLNEKLSDKLHELRGY